MGRFIHFSILPHLYHSMLSPSIFFRGGVQNGVWMNLHYQQVKFMINETLILISLDRGDPGELSHKES